MWRIIWKAISLLAAFLCTVIGLVYTIRWVSGLEQVDAAPISYFSSLAFFLVGLGICALYSKSSVRWSLWVGLLLLGVALLKGYALFFGVPVWGQYWSFFAPSSGLRLVALIGFGCFFLLWKESRWKRWCFVYGGVGFFCFGWTLLSLLSSLLFVQGGLPGSYPLGMIALVIASVGLLAALISLGIQYNHIQVWIAYLLGMFLLTCVIFLSLGLYWNEYAVHRLTHVFIAYAFVGGVIFSLAAALLVYFWLLNRVQLRKVEELESKFRSFVENTEEWIWSIDRAGVFTYSNEAIQAILGYSAQEIIGSSYTQLEPHHCVDLKGWSRRLAVWTTRQGERRILESTATPIWNEAHECVGLRGADRDVTAREREIEARQEFFALINHEMRTPLTSIHGALGILAARNALSEETRELVQLAYRNSRLLIHLIQEMGDFEKISLGKLQYHIEPTLLAPLVQSAIQSAKLLTEQNQVVIDLKEELPEVVVEVDPERLMQVLLNFLSNALKFSPLQGHIWLSMVRMDHRVRVSVKDEGPGIPAAFRNKIFGRFEQFDNTASGRPRGMGLGLYISKHIIEHLGGTIGFTSEEGQGATFYFELPCGIPPDMR